MTSPPKVAFVWGNNTSEARRILPPKRGVEINLELPTLLQRGEKVAFSRNSTKQGGRGKIGKAKVAVEKNVSSTPYPPHC